ncbi:MAG: HDIG domain-containing protein [Dehalococcoidia bacterium]
MTSTASSAPAPLIAGIALGFVVALVTALAMLPVAIGGADVRAGDRAPSTFLARRDAQFESTVITDQLRDQAEARVPVQYFPPDPAVATNQRAAVSALLDGLANVRRRSLPVAQRLAEAQTLPGAATIDPSVIGTVLDFDAATFDDFRLRVDAAIVALMAAPILESDINGKISNYLATATIDSNAEFVAVREVLQSFVVQNVRVDDQATSEARAAARAAVPPSVVTLTQGQVVVQEADVLDEADIEALEQTGVISSGFDTARALGGILVAALSGLLVGTGASRAGRFRRPAAPAVWLAGAVLIAAPIAARVAFPFIFPDDQHLYIAFVIPFAAAALVAAALGGFAFGAIVAVVTGMSVAMVAITVPDLAGSRFSNPIESFAIGFSGTHAGVAGSAVLSSRHSVLHFALAGIAAAVAISSLLGAIWLVAAPRSDEDLRWLVQAALGHGFGAALLASLTVSFFAGRLGLRHEARLERLLRGDHPLLMRLQDEAPGTYHHSMMVATLAEAAARRIGADARLARVGAMFHDIGKLAQPRYYIENTVEGEENPHHELPPEASAARIREHVTNGVVLARQYGLPAEVRVFIPEHHGTRLIAFFYRQAVKDSPLVDEADFQYAGPRPQSRETAIVMLADSCEATVRALEARENVDIRKAITDTIQERSDEGELDDSGLTVRDIRVIADTFRENLRALHHRRIAYPPAAPEEALRLGRA